MIFVGDGGAEEGEDAVAQRLRDITVIAMHGVHHDLEGRVEGGARFFRIDSFDEGHRALEIGEEHGDGLALALEGAPRVQDLVGEMCGGVGGRPWTRFHRCRFEERMPAPVAELLPLWVPALAARALHVAHDAGTAFATEPRVFGVFVSATRAGHAGRWYRSGARVPPVRIRFRAEEGQV